MSKRHKNTAFAAMSSEERKQFFRDCGFKGLAVSKRLEKDREFKVCAKCGQQRKLKTFYKAHRSDPTAACKHCIRRITQPKKDIKLTLWESARSRSLKNNIEFTITLDDIDIPDVCPIFKKTFIRGDSKWTYSLDRIDVTYGYVPGNIAVISNEANRLKSYMTLELLQTLVDYVSMHKLPEKNFDKTAA